jgi:hypothetical protein
MPTRRESKEKVKRKMATVNVMKNARHLLTNIAEDNNKRWNIKLHSDGYSKTNQGQVREEGQQKLITSYSEGQFDFKYREKEKKGYRPQKIPANSAESGNLQGEPLARVATEQIITSSVETQALVQYLTRVNVHRILETTTTLFTEARALSRCPYGILNALEASLELVVKADQETALRLGNGAVELLPPGPGL